MYLCVCISLSLSTQVHTQKEKKVIHKHIPKIQLQEIKCSSWKGDLWGMGKKETLLKKSVTRRLSRKELFYLSSSCGSSQAGLKPSDVSLYEAIYKYQETCHKSLIISCCIKNSLVYLDIFLPLDLLPSLYFFFRKETSRKQFRHNSYFCSPICNVKRGRTSCWSTWLLFKHQCGSHRCSIYTRKWGPPQHYSPPGTHVNQIRIQAPTTASQGGAQQRQGFGKLA